MSVRQRKTTMIPAISTILVPTDFSRGADQALGRALRLPLARGATVHLLHVMSEPLFDAPLRRARVTTAKAMADGVRRARAQANALGLTVSMKGTVVAGRPFEQIVRQSRLLGADLIVLGRHGRRPVRDMFIGSTADRVIRYGDLPVLVVNRPARRPYSRPIAAIDFDETTRSTLETLLRVSSPSVTEIMLVHAYLVPLEGAVSRPSSRASESIFRKAAREQAVANAGQVMAALPPWGVSWRTVFAYGDARRVVLTRAHSHQADIVALGTHARSGLSSALLGSVAEWILEAAHCDVLVARPARFTFQPLA
ncbi:MAG TPA: universal stress protein [Rhodanobacter sp.]|nr:universal stress protein [Rhodanobacter sp.]